MKESSPRANDKAFVEMSVLRYLSAVHHFDRTLKHPAIIEAIDWIEEKSVSVMSYAESGTLQAHLRSREKQVGNRLNGIYWLEWPQQMVWAWQLALAVDYIHQRGIVHRN
jgi:serine/threonine protein kinase